jgi:hypothetical protein
MKNKKRIVVLLFAASLSLVGISYAVEAQDSTIKSLDNEYINLGTLSSYTVDEAAKVPKAAVNAVSIIKGEEAVEGTTLSKPGDYTVKLDCEDITYNYKVFCYRRGDANIDGVRDVRDLVAAYDTTAHTEISAEYGADMDGNQEVNIVDYDLLRKLLVGQGLTLPELNDKIDEYMTISDVTLSGSELSITITNNSKVWEAGTESYVTFTYYDINDEVLGTDKKELRLVEPGSTATCKLILPSATADVKVTEFDFDYWSSVVK